MSKQTIMEEFKEIDIMARAIEEALDDTKPLCIDGIEPHEFQIEDFSPEQADLVCVNCGKKK